MATSLIEQYANLLVRFGNPRHPVIVNFVQNFSGVPGFLTQVQRLNRVFLTQQRGGFAQRQQQAALNFANAVLILTNTSISPSGTPGD